MLEGGRLERGGWGLPTPLPRSKAKQREIQRERYRDRKTDMTYCYWLSPWILLNRFGDLSDEFVYG